MDGLILFNDFDATLGCGIGCEIFVGVVGLGVCRYCCYRYGLILVRWFWMNAACCFVSF